MRANSDGEAVGPSDAVVDHYLDQIDHFVNLYQRVALSASEAGNWARGAVYGQIFGAATIDDDSRIILLAKDFLREAARGAQMYGSRLKRGTLAQAA